MGQKRKVVKHGESTLTISLPAKWVKVYGILPGNFLEVEQTPDGLLVSSKSLPLRKIDITISGYREWHVHRILRHIYNSGYDQVNVHYSSKEQIAQIRKCLDILPGFEIVESHSGGCVIKCVSSLDSAEYSETITRVLWLILSQFDYFIEDCTKKKPVMVAEAKELHKTVFRLINLCRRLVNKKPQYDAVTSKYLYRFLTSLIYISEGVIFSYDESLKSGVINLTDKEFIFVKSIRELYYTLIIAYQNLNVDKTNKFFEDRERILMNSFEMLKGKNPIIIHYFINILKELSSIGKGIIILKINEDIKKNTSKSDKSPALHPPDKAG